MFAKNAGTLNHRRGKVAEFGYIYYDGGGGVIGSGVFYDDAEWKKRKVAARDRCSFHAH